MSNLSWHLTEKKLDLKMRLQDTICVLRTMLQPQSSNEIKMNMQFLDYLCRTCCDKKPNIKHIFSLFNFLSDCNQCMVGW